MAVRGHRHGDSGAADSVRPDQETAQAFSAQAMELLWGLEQKEISWRLDTSEVYRANVTSGSEGGFLLSEELAGLLESGLELSRRSEGAFDMTLGSVTRLWNIDEWAAENGAEGFPIPSREELARALSVCGYEKLRLQRRRRPGRKGTVPSLPAGGDAA